MSRKKTMAVWLCLGSCVMAACVTVAAVAHHSREAFRPRATVTTTNHESTTPLDVQSSEVGRIEVELITVTPRGFEPREIKRSAAPFILAVHNRSGLQSMTLRLSLTTSEVPVRSPMFEVTATRERLNWNNLENLAPGRYVLTEVNHPEWFCYVTITL